MKCAKLIQLYVLASFQLFRVLSINFNWEYVPIISGRESGGCDFPGNNITSRHFITLEDCRHKCQFEKFAESTSCTHYVWDPNFKNGTCYFKSGTVSERTAESISDPSIRCGFRSISWIYSEPDDVWWSFNCRYFGEDLISMPSPGELCGSLCRNTTKCTHFNVKVKQNKINCDMKTGGASKNDAVLDLNSETGSNVCGILNNNFQTDTSTSSTATTTLGNPTNDEDCECICN